MAKAIKPLSSFINSREHNFPYFNIFEIRMYLKIDGMSYFSREHFFFFLSGTYNKTEPFTEDILNSMGHSPRWMDGVHVQSCPTLVTPWTVARQAPLSMEFSRQEYWSGLPFPTSGDLPDSPGYPKQISFCYTG